MLEICTLTFFVLRRQKTIDRQETKNEKKRKSHERVLHSYQKKDARQEQLLANRVAVRAESEKIRIANTKVTRDWRAAQPTGDFRMQSEKFVDMKRIVGGQPRSNVFS